MKTSSLLGWLVIGASLLAACGDDTATGGSGGGGASAGGQGQGGEPQGGDQPGGAGVGGEAQGGAGQGGAAASAIVPTITDAAFFGNCKPVIGPDPLGGSFTAQYLNGGTADGTLTATSIELALTGIDATLTWRFDVDPDSSGVVVAGDTAEVIHMKVADSGAGDKGDITPCSYCGSPGVLSVTWDDDAGGTADATFDVDFQCAF